MMNRSHDHSAFWNTRENRKVFFRAKDCVKKQVNSEVKVVFLKRCTRMKVIPKTLHVNNAAPGKVGGTGGRWQDAQLRGGLALTREATAEQI